MFSYSIVFTTYNNAAEIVQFLEEIAAQTIKPQLIVMADGGSKDNTVQLAEAFRNRINCPLKIISGKRLNIAAGYNASIKTVTTEYVGIVGVGNHYDRRFFECLKENSLRTDVDVSYAPVRGWNSTNFSKWYNSYLLNGDNGSIGKIPSNHGALLKNTVFQKTGYFYEDFFYAGEDTEFYYRALSKGITFGVVKEARVYWETPRTIQEYCRQIDLYTIGDMQAFGNYELFVRKRKSAIKWMILITALITGFIIRPIPGTLTTVLLVVFYYFIRYRKYGFIGSMYCMLSQFLPTIYLFKNIRYLCPSKKAKRC